MLGVSPFGYLCSRQTITYVDIKKGKTPKLVSLLTNDFDMPMETVVAIYRRRWQIESLFKQIKQNFPLKNDLY